MPLRIKQATFKNKTYTPSQWEEKLEVQNISKKEGEEKLRCCDGCELSFRRGYQRKDGVEVQPHFFHVNKDRDTSCLYVKKYGNTGESNEHINAKEMIASMRVKFERVCCHPGCLNCVTIPVDKTWTSKTERRMNNRWLMDVVYYDKDGKIQCVIEIKHKHAVDGEKRRWLMQQPFEYIEVATNTSIYRSTFTIIDMCYKARTASELFYCKDTDLKTCRTEEKEIREYFTRYMMTQDLTNTSSCVDRWMYHNKYDYTDLEPYNFEIGDEYGDGAPEDLQKLIDSIPKVKREQELQREDINRYRRKQEQREKLKKDPLYNLRVRMGKKRRLPPPPLSICDHCHGYGMVKGMACWFC